MHIRPVYSRRELLERCANGFGAIAMAALAAKETLATQQPASRTDPLAPRQPHFAPKVASVIFLYMDGGPSQMDTFDPKPLLTRYHGQTMPGRVEPTQFNNIGRVMQSPWRFRRYGQSGLPVSDLFPHVGACADDLCVIRSLTSNFNEHTNANYLLHSGNGQQGRPSMGAWLTYGLGSQSAALPGFVVLETGQIPPGGVDCFSSGFLPASFQGSLFRRGAMPVADLQSPGPAGAQRRKLDLLRRLDSAGLERSGTNDPIESAIANYELAFRMQTGVPDLMNLSGESDATRRLYGVDDSVTQAYGTACLCARRLIQRGVRFVEVLCPPTGGDRWDQHSGLRVGHQNNANAVDKPIAGLLRDLKSRGLLENTLVLWGGEFGRTPMAQGTDGRDHNPFGFTMWLAGGGVKGGFTYGATDDFGYHVVENRVEMHDLHATMLHLLGLDHTRLTVRFGGRDMRLTDVHGQVINAILA
jgi:hypothetical protein